MLNLVNQRRRTCSADKRARQEKRGSYACFRFFLFPPKINVGVTSALRVAHAAPRKIHRKTGENSLMQLSSGTSLIAHAENARTRPIYVCGNCTRVSSMDCNAHVHRVYSSLLSKSLRKSSAAPSRRPAQYDAATADSSGWTGCLSAGRVRDARGSPAGRPGSRHDIRRPPLRCGVFFGLCSLLTTVFFLCSPNSYSRTMQYFHDPAHSTASQMWTTTGERDNETAS